MKLLTCRYEGKERVGLLSAEGTPDAPGNTVVFLPYPDMNALIEDVGTDWRGRAWKRLNEYLSHKGVSLEDVERLAPVPRPRQDVICLGMNYLDHAEESARYNDRAFAKEKPVSVYFSKRVSEAAAPDTGIPSHSGLVERLDYEAELAVIIGRAARDVKPEEAEDYIFGYTVLNDVSARDLQTGHMQWYFGKSLDGFTPMGPYIQTADEIAFPPALAVSSRVNGELRQSSNTSLLIHSIPAILAELTRGMTLLPGTIIATGTPAGVGMGFDPPRFLKPGDVVECEIERIGVLRNTIL